MSRCRARDCGDTSSPLVKLAIQSARKRGTVVAVGTVGMHIPRSPFYEKEVNFRTSCSYCPGRYDPDYEERGRDYPLGYVRWTENRNMEAVLAMMAQRKLNALPPISRRIPVQRTAWYKSDRCTLTPLLFVFFLHHSLAASDDCTFVHAAPFRRLYRNDFRRHAFSDFKE